MCYFITYYILRPLLIVGDMAGALLAAVHFAPIILTLGAALLVGAGVMLAPRCALTPAGPAFTSLFQGAIRSNIYAALAAAVALHGAAGLPLAAVAVPPTCPRSTSSASRSWAATPAPHRPIGGGSPGQWRATR